MGETTGIAWTEETINAVIGCEILSPGCAHCYAITQTPARVLRAQGHETWGPEGVRHETLGWVAALRAAHRKGVKRGKPVKVFAGSMSDPFLVDPVWERVRPRYFAECAAATGCEVQVLTKRPENILRMVPPLWLTSWPAHVWIGCTVEDQQRAEERIPHLLRVPAKVRFLSVEPMLGAVDLQQLRCGSDFDAEGADFYDCLKGVSYWRNGDFGCYGPAINWVIAGGESGPKARPFDLAWARSLRDQCKAAAVAFFFKQGGARPVQSCDDERRYGRIPDRFEDSHGADPAEWPADLRVQSFPEVRP